MLHGVLPVDLAARSLADSRRQDGSDDRFPAAEVDALEKEVDRKAFAARW